jgi:allophanate hydrolase subunit 2
VPAHSVAIGAEYTGIYPVASAGGWHLLGRALDAPRFELGDRVRFEAATSAPNIEPRPEEPSPEPSGPHLLVTRIAGLALFVDGGRAGQMHRGMPPGGPLVRSAFDRANGWVGNEVLLDASVRIRGSLSVTGPRERDRSVATPCAIELTGTMEVEARGGTVLLAGDERVALREGERFALTSGPRRVAYLAIEGGFDAPLVEASRNALLSAGIGRPLRRGDVLRRSSPEFAPLAQERADRSSTPAAATRSGQPGISALPNSSDPIVLRAGPDLDDERRAELEAAAFTISPTSDRAGTRLTGPTLRSTANRHASTPMVEGAIELTPSGLVVLGPDHPTTGGYPVLALLASESRDAFFTRPLGASVRFLFGDHA